MLLAMTTSKSGSTPRMGSPLKRSAISWRTAVSFAVEPLRMAMRPSGMPACTSASFIHQCEATGSAKMMCPQVRCLSTLLTIAAILGE